MRSRHLLKHDVAKGRTRALWDRYLDSSQFFRLLLLRLQVFGNIILNIFMIQTQFGHRERYLRTYLWVLFHLLQGRVYKIIYFQRVVSKTKHSKTKTEARSTQDSKTKHPKLENEAPKIRKRITQNSKTKHPNLENEAPKSRNHCTSKDYNF